MAALLTILTIVVWVVPCFIIAGLLIAMLGCFVIGLCRHLFTSSLILAIAMAFYFVCLY